MWRGRPTWVEIDLDALGANVRALKAWIGPKVKLQAVVKANAYGHGTVPVAQVALGCGASCLGVACVDEGIQLRQAGVLAPILVLGYSPAWEAERIVTYSLTPTVNARQLALALASASTRKGVITPVHVKIDTGMGRFGLLPSEALPFVQGLVSMPGLHLDGISTHFASADEADKSYTHKQMSVFRDVLTLLQEHDIRVPCCHAANSAATIDLPETHLDMVRCGIAIYGIYPSEAISRFLKLRPALSWRSRAGRVQRLPPGSSISYNRTYTTRGPTKVALVPVGYGDGLSRALSNRGEFLVRGHRAPIVGRICMDQCVIDVDQAPEIALDEEVVLIGWQEGEGITADEVASRAGTIAYEVLCSISVRVPRLYLRQGQVVAVDNNLALGDTAAEVAAPCSRPTPML